MSRSLLFELIGKLSSYFSGKLIKFTEKNAVHKFIYILIFSKLMLAKNQKKTRKNLFFKIERLSFDKKIKMLLINQVYVIIDPIFTSFSHKRYKRVKKSFKFRKAIKSNRC